MACFLLSVKICRLCVFQRQQAYLLFDAARVAGQAAVAAHHPMVEQGLRAEEAGALLQAFFKDLRVRLAARPKWKRPAPPAENMKKP